MQTSPVSRGITIQNKQGLHVRPAEQFVRLASQYESKIQLVRDGRRVEARNMIDLLTLGATQGTQLTLEAEVPTPKPPSMRWPISWKQGFYKKTPKSTEEGEDHRELYRPRKN